MKTRLLPAATGVAEAVRLLAAGEPVALPTETVYGLGADALNSVACAKIFEAKERPLYDPLIVHLPDLTWLDRLCFVSDEAARLAGAFWPGPLTMVLPRRPEVPDIVTSGQETVAVRLSAHPVFQAVSRAFGRPIAAPSANRFGRISPTTPAHVLAELDTRIPLILDGGPCEHGIESTIVLVEDGSFQILRHGPITAEQLSVFAPIRTGPSDLASPGNLKSHYAPRTPLTLVDLGTAVPAANTGLLAWTGGGEGFAAVEYLSPRQDLREAAANLYGAMRRLDESGVREILAERVPAHGLGAAIMERLEKAAARD